MTEPVERVVRTEVIAPEQAEALANLIGAQVPRTILPPLWHWTHLLERRPHADLGPDGHPTFGIPAPPGPGRKRMFAGGVVTTYDGLRLGRPATRSTYVADAREKQGRSGSLTFVTVRNEYAQDGRIVVVDDYDIVYRGAESGSPPQQVPSEPPPPDGRTQLRLRVDEALLFRFSALTYNAHRIHYDHNWVREEGYPDLVVHGPLQALMMGELLRAHGPGLVGRRFSYRLVSPMIGPQTLTVTAVEGGAEVHDARGTRTAVGSLSPVVASDTTGG